MPPILCYPRIGPWIFTVPLVPDNTVLAAVKKAKISRDLNPPVMVKSDEILTPTVGSVALSSPVLMSSLPSLQQPLQQTGMVLPPQDTAPIPQINTEAHRDKWLIRDEDLDASMEMKNVVKSEIVPEAAGSLPGNIDATSTLSVHTSTAPARLYQYKWCSEAKKILDEPNAGGSSELSEAWAMQFLHDQLGARGVVSEMEVSYWSEHWKRCDFITTIHDLAVAVSVTRAMTTPGKAFGWDEAVALFGKYIDMKCQCLTCM